MFRRMTRERYLSDDELHRFMAVVRERRHVHQPRDYALFSLLANTGMRPAEARALVRESVQVDGPHPLVRVFRLKKMKTVPEFDDLPMPVETAEAMRSHMATLPEHPQQPLFVIQRRQLQRVFYAYCKAAGIVGVNLYSLRHTAATRIYCATRDLRTVQAVLGHETPDMTSLYAHVPDSLLKDLARTFPAIV